MTMQASTVDMCGHTLAPSVMYVCASDDLNTDINSWNKERTRLCYYSS